MQEIALGPQQQEAPGTHADTYTCPYTLPTPYTSTQD